VVILGIRIRTTLIVILESHDVVLRVEVRESGRVRESADREARKLKDGSGLRDLGFGMWLWCLDQELVCWRPKEAGLRVNLCISFFHGQMRRCWLSDVWSSMTDGSFLSLADNPVFSGRWFLKGSYLHLDSIRYSFCFELD